MVSLSVIVPAYNKEKILGTSLAELKAALQGAGLDFEIVLVNDGSRDNTLLELEKFAKETPQARVVDLKQNIGKGGALLEGFRHSTGALVLFADADTDLPPSQIPRFLEYMERFRADVIIGSKNHPKSIVKYPLLRKILSRGYLILNFVLFQLPVSDTQVGMKLFRREVLEHAVPKMLVKKYAYDLELLVLARYGGFHIKDAPIELKYGIDFGSGVDVRQIFWIFWDTMAIWYRLKVLKYYDRVGK
ncbi:glycosyltransferase [Candidatus Micrarchaeota archaeon]|nr:glycosyltransferase [Candidatus Micrarchaeota archaeon]